MMEGLGPIIYLATLAEPVVAVAGIASGLAARRKWHLVPASLAAPAAYMILEAPPGVDFAHFGMLLPFLVAAGGLWSCTAFAAKHAWRS